MIITKYIPKTAKEGDIDLHIHYIDENSVFQIEHLDFEYSIIGFNDGANNILRIVVPDDFDWNKPIDTDIHCMVGSWHTITTDCPYTWL